MHFSKNTSLSRASTDFLQGLTRSPLWAGLAWQDTKQRYRRSLLGPFWITVSTGVMVAAMGPLYGTLLGQDIGTYLQYLSVSLILWAFISSTINEAGSAFVGAEGYIKQIALPLTVHVFRMLAKNGIMLAHNIVIVVAVLVIFPPPRWESVWLFPLGLALVTGNLLWISLLLAVLSARFRDVPQLVGNLVQVAFFLSPIIWRAEMLGPRSRLIAELNPLYHFMEVVRSPLLGSQIQATSWLVTFLLMVGGSLVAFLVFARLRARVPYWL